MKRISIPKKAWLPGLLWGLFAAVTALGLRGCRLSAEGSLLQHLRYALAYGGLRGKAVCLVLVGCAVLFSLMGQYVPWGRAAEFPGIDRRLRPSEARRAEAYMAQLGLEGFAQDPGAAEAEFIPSFDLTGVEGTQKPG